MTMSITLPDLPTELLLAIFEEACTNPLDTETARALSLTSHRIRETSAPFRYRILSIAGADSLSTALDHLTSLPAAERHVHHLFLADTAASAAEDVALADPHDVVSVERAENAFADAALFPARADALLRLLGPDIRTLTLAVFNPLQTHFLSCLLAIPFPRLTTLALRLSAQRVLFPATGAGPHMPALQRLHFSSPRYLSSSAAPLLERFAGACARLTHIRLSDLRLMPGCAATLARLLGRLPLRDQYGWLPSSPPAGTCRLPMRVRTLAVQLAVGGVRGSESEIVRRMAAMDYGDGFVLLEGLKERRGMKVWKDEWRRAVEGDHAVWEGMGEVQ